MNLQLGILSEHAMLTDGDVCEINALMKQLSPNAMCVRIDDILEVIARGACLAVMRDLNEPRGNYYHIVGMATLVQKRQLMGLFGLIEDVVVDEIYRGHGIAERLNRRLIEEAKLLGMKHLDLTSNPKRVAANKLYDTLGYVDRDTRVRRLVLTRNDSKEDV